MEDGGGVQNLLGDLLSLTKAEGPGTNWTSGRTFSYSSNRALQRAASEGSVKVVVSASSASDSFRTLEGVAPSLELVVVDLWEFKGKSDLEASTRQFLLWSRLISLIRVSVGSLTDLLLDLLTGL